jgi:hypothetical protein
MQLTFSQLPGAQASDDLPEGFAYQQDFLSLNEEEDLLTHFRELDFHAFESSRGLEMSSRPHELCSVCWPAGV